MIPSNGERVPRIQALWLGGYGTKIWISPLGFNFL